MPTADDATARIYLLKRDLLSLRRAVSPLVDVCNRLIRFDLPHIPADTRPYFRDVYDHIVRLNETIDAQRELLTTALEAHLSLMSVAQNEHMKRYHRLGGDDRRADDDRGIYGMNFENMPELEWSYGYHISIVVMVCRVRGTLRRFKCLVWSASIPNRPTPDLRAQRPNPNFLQLSTLQFAVGDEQLRWALGVGYRRPCRKARTLGRPEAKPRAPRSRCRSPGGSVGQPPPAARMQRAARPSPRKTRRWARRLRPARGAEAVGRDGKHHSIRNVVMPTVMNGCSTTSHHQPHVEVVDEHHHVSMRRTAAK